MEYDAATAEPRNVRSFAKSAFALYVLIFGVLVFIYWYNRPEPPPQLPPPMAMPINSAMLVNGEEVWFSAYLIRQSNFLRLRDVAYILNGTERQFDVGWDGAARAVIITTGVSYTPLGGEMARNYGEGRPLVPAASRIYFDGAQIYIAAYLIDGSYHFGLRDLARILNFNLSWQDRSIAISTTEGYADTWLGTIRVYGGTYEGEIFNGQPHGMGIMMWDSGYVFGGNWLYGMPYGYGWVMLTDGTVMHGRWENGDFVAQ